MFGRDDGSVGAKIPGNWEAARPVEICRICSRFIVVYV